MNQHAMSILRPSATTLPIPTPIGNKPDLSGRSCAGRHSAWSRTLNLAARCRIVVESSKAEGLLLLSGTLEAKVQYMSSQGEHLGLTKNKHTGDKDVIVPGEWNGALLTGILWERHRACH